MELREDENHGCAATAEEVAECVVNTICCGAMTGEEVNLNSGVYFPA